MTDPRRTPPGPRLPVGVLTRPRLLRRLDSGAPLTVIKGPSGWGKSVLMAQHAQQVGTACAWVALAPATRTRRLFWLEVINATQILPWAGGRPAPEVDRIFDGSSDPVMELTRYLAAGQPILLAIDSFECVEDEVVIADLVDVLIHADNVTVALTTRTDTPLAGIPTKAVLDVTTVDADDLGFDVAETAAALAAGGIRDADEVASAVRRTTEGSPLATRLVALSLAQNPRSSPSDIVATFANAGQAYIRTLLTARPDASRVHQFMLKTAVAESLTEELALELAPEFKAAEMIQTVARMGTGMYTGPDHRRTFRYTPLIRTALREQLRETATEQIAGLRRIVARWEAHNGSMFTAFQLALELDDLDLASSLVKQGWMQLLRYHLADVIELTRPIGVWRLRRQPLLAMLIALAHNARAPGRFKAVEYFALASIGSRLPGGSVDASDEIILRTLEGAALRLIGHPERALGPAARALAALKSADDDTLRQLTDLLPTLWAHNGITMLYNAEPAAAVAAFENSHLTAGYVPRTSDQLHALALRAGTAAIVGNLQYARTLLEYPGPSLLPHAERGSYIATFYHIGRIILHIEDMDFDSASAELAHISSAELRTNEHRGILLELRATIEAAQSDSSLAAAWLEEATATEPELQRLGGSIRARLQVTAATLFTVGGDYHHARRLLGAIPSRHRVMTWLSWSLLHSMENNVRDALHSFAQAALPAGTPRDRATYDSIGALVHWRAGNLDQARRHFNALVTISSKHGMRLPLMMIPRSDLLELLQAYPSPALSRLQDAGVPDLFRTAETQVRLTKRESLVINLLAQQRSAPQIAEELAVSLNTVKTQMKSAYRKLGAHDRDQAVAAARRLGLLNP